MAVAPHRPDQDGTRAARLQSRASGRLPRLFKTLTGKDATAGHLLGLGIAALGIIVFGLFTSPYFLRVAAMVAIYGIAVIGLNFLVGHAGQTSFGHNAFLAIGGYTTAILTTRFNVEPILALLAGIVLAVIIGFIIGYPTLKLRGVMLAIATMALGLAVYALAISWSSLTGGFAGIAGVPCLRIGPVSLRSMRNQYWLAWILIAILLVVVTRLVNSRFGLAVRTTALDQDVAQSLGINVHYYKVFSFCISAAVGALAGSLLVHLLTFTSPEAYSSLVNMQMFAMLFVGGLGNDLGMIAGAALCVVTPQLLSRLKDYYDLFNGVMLVLILLLCPRGLLASIDFSRLWQRLHGKHDVPSERKR